MSITFYRTAVAEIVADELDDVCQSEPSLCGVCLADICMAHDSKETEVSLLQGAFRSYGNGLFSHDLTPVYIFFGVRFDSQRRTEDLEILHAVIEQTVAATTTSVSEATRRNDEFQQP